MVAFVVGRPGYQHQSIATHCRKQLPPEKRPKYIYYLDKLPHTANGKIDRPALKAAPVRLIEPL